jgi:HK97 family phage major capsid protein
MPTETMTDDQILEFATNAAELKSRLPEIETLSSSMKTLQDDSAQLRQHVTDLRRRLLTQPSTLNHQHPRRAGLVTDDCARYLAATFIAHCEKSGKLEALCSITTQREALTAIARETLGLTTRTALSTTDIPLPVQYAGQIRELISDFGVVRRKMHPYPIASVALSGAFPEKSPTITFASLESHKIGGIVRLPREIDEQSVVPMGQFLARYGAVEFARAEDTWGFLADGSTNFETVSGVVSVSTDNDCLHTLAAGKTKPSDATLDDFRALRTQVNKAALNGRLSAYYLDSTWETRLPSFRTTAEPNVYQRLPDGSAILDGYPIVWTDVLTPYATAAAANKPLAVFGAMSFWWMGEHGTPRIDTSEHVWFANDQLAVRFIEEIDFDYCAGDATAVLMTAAS